MLLADYFMVWWQTVLVKFSLMRIATFSGSTVINVKINLCFAQEATSQWTSVWITSNDKTIKVREMPGKTIQQTNKRQPVGRSWLNWKSTLDYSRFESMPKSLTRLAMKRLTFQFSYFLQASTTRNSFMLSCKSINGLMAKLSALEMWWANWFSSSGFSKCSWHRTTERGRKKSIAWFANETNA